MSIDHLDLTYDSVIPTALLVNQNIEPNCIKFYAFVRGLTKLHGYCYATNEYLASLMKSDMSSVKRWIHSLKEEGYLEIHTEKNGIHWQRHIYLSDKFKKSLRRLKNELPPAQNSAPPSSKMSHIIEDNINIDIKKREEAKPPTPLFSFKRVSMNVQEYEKLIQEFGEPKIKEILDRLDEYADINPKRFKQYANHAVVIRKWLREDKEKFFSNKKEQITDEHKDVILAGNIKNKVKGMPCDKDIILGHNYIEFHRGQYTDVIKFGDNGFKDQCINALRKMSIFFEDLS